MYGWSLYYVRLEDKIVCIKIYSNGEMYHIGAGKKFNSIGDLIVHYKEHPIKTVEGTDIHLDQVTWLHITKL